MDSQTKSDMEAMADLVAKLQRQSQVADGFMRWPEPTDEERAFLDRVLKEKADG